MGATRITATVVLLAIGVINSQYTYTQLAENTFFSSTTPEINKRTELGTETGQQYTIWGWFRFNGETAAISNIITFRTLKESEKTPVNDPDHPECPYTKAELKEDPSLSEEPDVKNNPNCSYENSTTKSKGPDLLYVNFDLGAPSGNTRLYSIIYLVQNGISSSGDSNMKLEGFTDLELVKNTWCYFAISADYSSGNVRINYFSFDNVMQSPLDKNFNVDFPSFALSEQVEMVIADVKLNPYFQSTSGFIGNIGGIELGLYHAESLEHLWLSYMNENARAYNGVLLEFYFDVYTKDEMLKSAGLNSLEYEIVGGYEVLYIDDNSTLGVEMHKDSSISLGNIDFDNLNDLVRSYTFYFQFSIKEAAADEIILLTRGFEGFDGYIKIFLMKADSGRVASITATGNEQTVSWQSDSVIDDDVVFKMLIGIAVSPAGSIKALYWDSRDQSEMLEIGKYFSFDGSAKPVVLLNNSAKDEALSVKLYRFRMANSASGLFYSHLTQDTTTQAVKDKGKDCSLFVSAYEAASGCFNCNNGISNSDYQCVEFCPMGFRNVNIDICVACTDDTCSDAVLTYWQATKLSDNTFLLNTNKRLRNFNSDADYFNVILADTGDEIPHTESIDVEAQTVEVTINYKASLVNEEISFVPNEMVLYDVDGNQMSTSSASVMIDRYCYVSPRNKTTLRTLAIIALVFLLVSVAMLLVFTIVYYKRIVDLSGLWKFTLHNWMKLQFMAFFLLLAVKTPCCVKEFLNVLYTIAVRWNHAFGGAIDSSNSNNINYTNGFDEAAPPTQFSREGIAVFILHNITVAFIVHVAILLAYAVVKIWDCFATSTANCMYKAFIWMEFTVLLVGYLMVEMHAFVFSFLNFRYAIFTHAYFTVSFLVALGYIVVFLAFWVFAAIRLIGSSIYFMNPLNYNRFYYFFAGYRDHKWARCHDLWLLFGYFIIGLMIGTATEAPVAQTVVILLVVFALLAETIIMKPWNFTLLWITDIVAQTLVFIVVILFVVMAGYDNSGCYTCGDREGGMCWAIVILLFLALLSLAVGLMTGAYLSVFAPHKFRSSGHKESSVKMEEEVFDYDNEELKEVSSYDTNKRDVVTGFHRYDTKENLLHRERDFATNAIGDAPVNFNGLSQINEDEGDLDIIKEVKSAKKADDNLAGYRIEVDKDNDPDYDQERVKGMSQFFKEAKLQKEALAMYDDVEGSGLSYRKDPQYMRRSNRSLSMDDDRQNVQENGKPLKPDTMDDFEKQMNISNVLGHQKPQNRESMRISNNRNPDDRNVFKMKESSQVNKDSKVSLRSSSAHNLRSLNDFDMDRYNKIMVGDSEADGDGSSYTNSRLSNNDSRATKTKANIFESYANKPNANLQYQFPNNSFYKSKRFDDPY